MPYTTVAFAESLDPAAAFVNFAAVPDDHVTVSGDDIQVPAFNHLFGYAVLTSLTVPSQARFRAPSMLEDGFEEYVQPVASGLTPGAQGEMTLRPQSPIALDPLEALQLQIFSNPGSAAEHYGICLLSDGPLSPVNGRIRTIRFTAAIAASANLWVNGALTFPVSLAAGRYQVVGCRVLSTNGVAFRLRFPGTWHRPGGLCVNAETDNPIPEFRQGRLGVWAEFEHTSPPTLDILGITDSAQVGALDVIKIR